MPVINSIEDLRVIARRRIPRALFDYIDRGSYDELTWTRNRDDLRAIELRQRVMVDVSRLSTGTTVLGEHWKMPVALAPTGLTGFFHRDGEIEAARAAQAAGVPFTLSTMSICSIEDVRAAVEGTFWFQLYLMRDRGFNAALISRAREARCSALMLTLDLPLQALRRRDPKNGLVRAPRTDAGKCAGNPAASALARRRVVRTAAHARQPRVLFPGTRHRRALRMGGRAIRSVDHLEGRGLGARALAGQAHPQGNTRCRGRAARSRAGVDAIVVSNHGGRQLDGATSTIAALPRVVDAVAGRCEVLLDGGVTSGQDVLKALALGARACLVGKAFLYGLAALGGEGVSLALQIIRKELEISMALCGVNDMRQVGPQVLVHRRAGVAPAS